MFLSIDAEKAFEECNTLIVLAFTWGRSQTMIFLLLHLSV
jgi:hypothetical protein